MKAKLALIGKDIGHSKSPEVYNRLLEGNVEYTLIDCETSEKLPSLNELEIYDGVSITAPYKRDYLDKVEVDEEVKKLNAINCLSFKNGKWYGHNTDYMALVTLFDEYFKRPEIKIALLGSGAMADITIKLFQKMNKKFDNFNRKRDGDLSNLDLSSYDLVINSCSRAFEFNGQLSCSSIFYDYNYAHKQHLMRFAEFSDQYVDGLALLYKQGEIALTYWNIKKN